MGNSRTKRVVLVTGCGAGVGLELAKQLSLSEKYIVIATTRSNSYINMQNILKESPQYNKTLFTKLLDVTSKKQIRKIVNQVNEQFGGIDILINNAAVCMLSTIEDYSEEIFNKAMNVNFYGAMNLCREVLPKMRMRGKGKILNISSVSGFSSLPGLGLYSVSKFALEAFSKALHSELAGTDIKVSLVQPGLINNGAHKKVLTGEKVEQSLFDRDSDSYLVYRFMTKIMNFYRKNFAPNSEMVAHRVARIVESRFYRFNNRITFDSQFLFFTKNFVPTFVKKWILRLAMKPAVLAWVPGKPLGSIEPTVDHRGANTLHLNPR